MSNTILHNFMFDIQRWNQSDALKVLSFEAANFYLRMLVACHETGELPSDPVRLAMELKAPLADVERLLPDVLPWFEPQTREVVGSGARRYVVSYLTNRVVDQVRSEAAERIQKNRENGKKGGRPQRQEEETERITDGLTGRLTGGYPNGYPEQNRTEQNNAERETAPTSGARPVLVKSSPPSANDPEIEDRLPLTATAVRERFPAADDLIIEKIAIATFGCCPDVGDGEIAAAIRETAIPHQQSPAFWLNKVPEHIRLKRKGKIRPQAEPKGVPLSEIA